MGVVGNDFYGPVFWWKNVTIALINKMHIMHTLSCTFKNTSVTYDD